MTNSLLIKRELERKAIHIASVVIPVFYAVTHQKELVLNILLILMAGFLLVDVLRLKISLVRKLFLDIFGPLLREKERQNHLTGATLLLIGWVLTVAIFKEKPAVVGMLFTSLADPAAAIVGRLWGKNKFWHKSLEGSTAFYFTASFIILAFTNYSWGGLLVALAITVLEMLPIGIDDNLTIPVITAYLLSVI